MWGLSPRGRAHSQSQLGTQGKKKGLHGFGARFGCWQPVLNCYRGGKALPEQPVRAQRSSLPRLPAIYSEPVLAPRVPALQRTAGAPGCAAAALCASLQLPACRQGGRSIYRSPADVAGLARSQPGSAESAWKAKLEALPGNFCSRLGDVNHPRCFPAASQSRRVPQRVFTTQNAPNF